MPLSHEAIPVHGREGTVTATIDGGDVVQIDVDNSLLEGSFNFTFSDIDGPGYFNDL